MKTRRLGQFDVSLVGLGCNNFGMRCDEKQTGVVVNAALDAGINFFDTADVYGATLSETYIGKALGKRRDEVILATKFGSKVTEVVGKEFKQIEDSGGGSRKWITRAVEDSLRRLGTDRIELYQMHAPDSNVPFEETLEALNELVKQGKVLEIGCSNYS
ncbi:MAG: aldo/keto reductase, partial [Acidimicrobiia bacterium]